MYMTVRVIHSSTVVYTYVQTMFPNDSTCIGLESDDVTLVLKLGLSTRQDGRTVSPWI